MKRKRATGKRKPKRHFAKEAVENEAALVEAYGLEGIIAEYASMGDEGAQSETYVSCPARGKSVADQRTDGNVNSLYKRNSSLLGGISNLAGSIAAADTSRSNGFRAKLHPRSETDPQRADTYMSDRQTDLEIQGAVNGRLGNIPNSLREMIATVIKDMSKEAGGISNLSKNLVDTPVSHAPVPRLDVDRGPKKNTDLLYKDPDYKEQELKAALEVIKKTMKLDSAGPFNIPVDPIALGIPDYFDVIKTPMDFGTIRNRLENGLKYMNSADVYKDVQYIWDNCQKYNKKGNYILELMKRVKANFMRYWIAAGLQKEPQSVGESPIMRGSRQRKISEVTPPTDNLDHLQVINNQPCSINKESSMQVINNQPCSINIEGSRSNQNSSQAQSTPNQDHTNTASTNIRKKRRGQGPTRCYKLLDTERQISVATNEFGQPVGPEACKLTSFLGVIARDGNLAPLNYLTWNKMPAENKENLWQTVLTKFEIDPSSRCWVLKSIGRKWKNFKALLKATCYDTHATDEERLADCDERVLPDQWSALVSQWKSEKWQSLSAKNKAIRARLKFGHTSGRKSFARICEEERAKRPDGKDPSLEELFIMTHTRKNGEPVNEEAAALISQLRESTAQQEGPSDNRSIPQDDASTQATGQSRKAGVLYGLGPLTTRVGVSAKPLRMVVEKNGPAIETNEQRVPLRQTYARRVAAVQKNAEALEMQEKLASMEQRHAQIEAEKNSEAVQMKEKLTSMEQTCAQMAAQMAAMVSMMATMQKSSLGEGVPSVAGNGLIPGGLPNHSEPASTSHHAVPSRKPRVKKTKR